MTDLVLNLGLVSAFLATVTATLVVLERRSRTRRKDIFGQTHGRD